MLNAELRGEVRSFLWIVLRWRPIGSGTEEGNSNGYNQVFIHSHSTRTHTATNSRMVHTW